MQPSSKPPTFCSTSMPSLASGRLTARIWRTTSIFFFRRSSEMFVPRPVACSGVRRHRQAAIAALVVVFDMPISPGRKQ